MNQNLLIDSALKGEKEAKMKVNIKTSVGRGSDPAKTTAHYVRARWGKNDVILTGTAICQGKRWKIEHKYYFEKDKFMKKEKILKNLFEGEI